MLPIAFPKHLAFAILLLCSFGATGYSQPANKALSHYSNGNFQKASNAFLELYENKLSDYTPDQNYYSTVLFFLSRSSQLAGKKDRAVNYYKECIQVYEEYDSENPTWFGLCSNYLAEIKQDRGDYELAKELLSAADSVLFNPDITPRLLPGDAWYLVLAYRDARHEDYIAFLEELQGQYKSEQKYGKAELIELEKLEIESKVRNGFLTPLQNFRKSALIALRFNDFARRDGKATEGYIDSMFNLAEIYRSYENNCEYAAPLYGYILQGLESLEGDYFFSKGRAHHRLARCKAEQNLITEAEYHYEAAIASKSQDIEEDPDAFIRLLINAGEFHRNRGRYLTAEDHTREAIRRGEKYLEKHDELNALAMNNLGGIFLETGRFREAEEFFIDALRIQQKQEEKNQSGIARTVNNLGGVYRELFDMEKADSLYHLALEITLEKFGEEHPETVERWNDLAVFYRQQGRFSEAGYFFSRIEKTGPDIFRQNELGYIIILNNLAGFYQDRGEYARAGEVYASIEDLILHHFGAEHVQFGILLQNKAVLENRMGNPQQAGRLYRQAIQVFENAGTAAERELATAYGNFGRFLMRNGNMNEADLILKKAAEVSSYVYGNRHPEYASSLNKRGELSLMTGDQEAAEDLFERAQQLFEEAAGPIHPGLISVLNNRALLAERSQNHELAIDIYTQLLDRTEHAHGKLHTRRATLLDNLAGAYQNAGKPETAVTLFDKAYTIRQALLGRDHPSVAVSLNNLAGLYVVTGDVRTAEEYYREAVKIRESVYGDYPPDHTSFLNNLAVLYLEQNRFDEAGELIQKATENLENEIQERFRFLPEDEKLVFIESVIHQYHFYQSYFLNGVDRNPEFARRALELDMMVSGIVLESLTQLRNTIAGLNDPQINEDFQQWLKIRSEIAGQYPLAEGQRSPDFAEQRAAASDLEQRLVRALPQFEIDRDWHHIRENLNSGEATVTFLKVHEYEAEKRTGEIKYGALVVRPGSEYPVYVPLFSEKDWEEVLQRDGLSDQQFVDGLYRSIGIHRAERPEFGEKLYTMIWEPLVPHLDGTHQVYYKPAGLLHQISMAAVPADEETLLSEQFSFTRVSGHIRSQSPEQDLSSMALFGGIAFDAPLQDVISAARNYDVTINASVMTRPAIRGNEGEVWEELPGTAVEVEKIAGLAGASGINTQLLKGNEAVEEAVKSQSGVKAPDILHFATHGFFFENTNPDPASAAVQTDAIDEQEPLNLQLLENPLFRAGLVFSGVNHAWGGNPVPAGLDDGILTAAEVSNLDLSGTTLAVLSACETGLGDIRGSEGVFGLQRAFKMAGVEYLLMSLWKVPDDETAEFMTLFYESLFAGNAISAAFHQAQQEMKTRYRDEPFKWAAFVLVR